MLIRRAPDIGSSEITDHTLYVNRRSFMIGAAAFALAPSVSASAATPQGQPLAAKRNPAFAVDDPPTKFESVTTYNNFYEFGVNKEDPARLAHTLKPRPWTVQVEGHIKRPKTYDIDELMKLASLEERVYRLRCVEGWSMVIPWIGYPLNALIKRVEPTSQAKFVEFTTLHDPEQFPGQRPAFFSFSGLDWPYVEGLRMDEALHPLTLLTFGLYGQLLPNQNGAPVRVVVPWKYGFKSAKSLVRIRVGEGGAPRVRLLLQCEPAGRSPALEPGDGTAHRRVPAAADAHVQRVRRSSRLDVHGTGSQEILLSSDLGLRMSDLGSSTNRHPTSVIWHLNTDI